jgi:DNA polymerase I-like protein with 3'-5' exonuclease and polymerase domains
MYLDIENKLGHPAPDRLLLVGYAMDDGTPSVLDAMCFGHGHGVVCDPGVADEMWGYLKDPGVVKVTHTKHDLRYLKLIGWDIAGDLHDTSVAAHLLNENTPLDLDWLAWHYAGLDMDKRLVRSGGRVFFRDDDGQLYDLETIDSHMWEDLDGVWLRFSHYCARDVDGERKLYTSLVQRLEESEWYDEYVNERVPYTNTLLRMETRGLPINIEATVELAEELAPEKERLGRELMDEASLPPSFNLNSGDQLAAYLFSRVLTLNDTLVYDKETVECLKSCLDGEHDDCNWLLTEHEYEEMLFLHHVTDFLPEGFVLDKLGRDRVHGHWTVKGRGLKATPPTRDKVTGELGKRPSTSSPELLYMHAGDPWVKKLCLEYRKLEKLLTTYLRAWPEAAVNARGETYGQALSRAGYARPSETEPSRVPGSVLAGAPPGSGAGGRSAAPAPGLGEDGPVATPGRARGPREPGQDGQSTGEPVRAAEVDSQFRDGKQANLELGPFRLYGRFSQTGTVTGRLSSSGPNLQQVPARGERGKQIRGLFRPPEGKVLVVGDYDQLEMRLMAHFSGDRELTRTFREGLDPHLVTAQAIFGMGIDPHGDERDIGKTLNYAMGYGAGPKKVAQVLSLAGYPTAKDVAQGYLAELARFLRGYFKWKQEVQAKAKRTGNVRTIGGGRRRLRAAFKDTANWKLVGYGERQAVNAIIQGSAADILRRAMVAWDEGWGEELPMVAQVHDEVVFEATTTTAAPLLSTVEHVFQKGHGFDLKVPLLFDPHIGDSWAAAKEGPDLAELFEEDEPWDE